MKHILVFLTLLFIFIFFIAHVFTFSHQTPTKIHATSTNAIIPSATPTIPIGALTTTLFVPYWTMNGKTFPATYDQIAYFGITANTEGIDTTEEGYRDLPQFLRLISPQTKTLLVVRLITPEVNDKILSDASLQQNIVQQSIDLARKDGFSGIVLDFEYNALAFDSVTKSISALSQNFSSQVHKNQLQYYQTLYGDTFYRARPFDVASIDKVSDGIFVMAYDFHKANGDPGPNFPLHALPDEDYSFTQMVSDFTSKVPAKKITILFGLFGYDWTMNNKNQSLGQAEVLTTLEAQKKFVSSCQLSHCKVVRDIASTERHVRYSGSDGRTHEVWFEDMGSVAKKQSYLKTNGISSTGFWAWSYF